MRPAFAIVLGLAMFSVVNASEPGQPLDATDFVFLVPGLTASTFIPRGCGLPWCNAGMACDSPPIDAAGSHYAFTEAGLLNCNGTEVYRRYVTRLRANGSVENVAFLDDRCIPLTGNAADRAFFRSLRIDNNAGCLYVVISTDQYGSGGVPYPPAPTTESLIVICGLPTQFEILQSYLPAPDPIVSFTVPANPEGLEASDHFDTYYGPLNGPRNFSQAQPLRCDYPASIPQPGDYLEAGIVPDPPSRQGYYYVTAATYQGETRYGRKRENGVLSGREPAGLPACVEATIAAARVPRESGCDGTLTALAGSCDLGCSAR